jgi:hypothetical protein
LRPLTASVARADKRSVQTIRAPRASPLQSEGDSVLSTVRQSDPQERPSAGLSNSLASERPHLIREQFAQFVANEIKSSNLMWRNMYRRQQRAAILEVEFR